MFFISVALTPLKEGSKSVNSLILQEIHSGCFKFGERHRMVDENEESTHRPHAGTIVDNNASMRITLPQTGTGMKFFNPEFMDEWTSCRSRR